MNGSSKCLKACSGIVVDGRGSLQLYGRCVGVEWGRAEGVDEKWWRRKRIRSKEGCGEGGGGNKRRKERRGK